MPCRMHRGIGAKEKKRNIRNLQDPGACSRLAAVDKPRTRKDTYICYVMEPSIIRALSSRKGHYFWLCIISWKLNWHVVQNLLLASILKLDLLFRNMFIVALYQRQRRSNQRAIPPFCRSRWAQTVNLSDSDKVTSAQHQSLPFLLREDWNREPFLYVNIDFRFPCWVPQLISAPAANISNCKEAYHQEPSRWGRRAYSVALLCTSITISMYVYASIASLNPSGGSRRGASVLTRREVRGLTRPTRCPDYTQQHSI